MVETGDRMRHADALYQRIVGNVQSSFQDFARKRAGIDPAFLRRMAKNEGWKAELSRIFALLPASGLPIRRKKFVFLSSRYDQLISQFNPDEAAIVGGPRDFALARRTGLKFRFTGDLLAASGSILFGRKFVPSRLVVASWLRFFSQQCDPCYLVVPNDTLPISLLLVKLADECSNMRVVCIQHGLFNSGFDLDDIEGRNSAINLVYCEAQRREMERRLPGALVEVMGFPANHVARSSDAPAVHRAILVGTGVLENFASYETALDIFTRVNAVLKSARVEVEYRPHPNEKGHDQAASIFSINGQTKNDLLSGDRKVFVGFASTLLYEASLAGHLVIILDDAAVPGYKISDFGIKLDSSEIDRLTEIVRDYYANGYPRVSPAINARSRFEAALAQATARQRRLGATISS
jgi:hypothetical protein